MAIGLVWAKVVAFSVMFVITMAVGIITHQVVRFIKRKDSENNIGGSMVVNILNCFAGGLFLGTFLLGLLPEVREVFEATLERYHIHVDFPVAEAVTGVGFFMVMILETVIQMCHGAGHGHTHGNTHGKENMVMNLSKESKDRSKPDATYRRRESVDRNEGRTPPDVGCNFQKLPTKNYTSSYNEQTTVVAREAAQLKSTENCNFKLGERNLAFGEGDLATELSLEDSRDKIETDSVQEATNSDNPTSNASPDQNNTVSEENKDASVDIAEPSGFTAHYNKTSSLRGIILVLALSLHTLFEGLALGLQSEEATIWTLLIAVSVHKAALVIGLAIELSQSDGNTIKMIYLNIFLFAVMSPLGIGIGTIVTETGSPNDLATDTASSILQALATGTFLYVTFFEVLNRELDGSSDLRKVLAVIIGFSGVIGLKFLGHEDSH